MVGRHGNPGYSSSIWWPLAKLSRTKLLRRERKLFGKQLQQAPGNVENGRQQHQAEEGFLLQARWNEQWMVDPYWEVDPQSPEDSPEDQPGSSSSRTASS